MKTLSLRSRPFFRRTPKPSGLNRVAKRIVRKRLENIVEGQVVVSENGHQRCYGRRTEDLPEPVTLIINDQRFYSEIAFGGVIGSGEAFMQGHWTCEQLTSLIRILLRNRHVLQGMNSGLAIVTKPVQKAFQWISKNTRSGSRRNISAHYDIGNDFYALWLDERMMYSSAVFERPEMSLEAAGSEKLDRICRKLRLSAGDHVLEIGTGWGGFAIFAAEKYGCKVTTTTISAQQYEYARQSISAAGLDDKITLLASDYRDLIGSYDKLVSIEMIEAVGWKYQDAFFKKCGELLKPHGQMLLQAITIGDQDYSDYKKSVDFIRRYIFPGGCLCSVTAMADSITRMSDMRVVHLEDIGPHYAKTLEIWRYRFQANLDRIRGLGYPEEFIRMWTFYLCYCEGGFIERSIGDVQMHLVKPAAKADVVGF